MVHELTQGISQLKCLSSCCENGLTLVRSYKGSKEYDPESCRYNLLILAVGGDGPSPSSKSIRSQNLSRWSVQIDSSELCDTLTFPIGLGVNLTRDLTEAKWWAYETIDQYLLAFFMTGSNQMNWRKKHHINQGNYHSAIYFHKWIISISCSNTPDYL